MLFLHPHLFLLARPGDHNYTLYFCSIMPLLTPILWLRTSFFVFPMPVGPSTLQWPPVLGTPQSDKATLALLCQQSFCSYFETSTWQTMLLRGYPHQTVVSSRAVSLFPDLSITSAAGTSSEGLALGLNSPSMLPTHLNARVAHEAVVRSAPAQGLARSPQAPHQLNP